MKRSPGRGQGVYATAPLPAGLLVPYGGVEVTPARVYWLEKHDRDRFLARTGGGSASGVDAHPALLPAGHGFAWPGSRLNEAAPGELYNCRLVWWPVAATRDQPAYPLAPPARLRFYAEVMAPVPAGAELLVSYQVCSRRSRKYEIAPPPPLSTPQDWGQHLGAAEARLLRAQRKRAMRHVDAEAARSIAAEAARAVRLSKLARARAALVLANAAKGRANRAAAAERCARMREKKLKRLDAA